MTRRAIFLKFAWGPTPTRWLRFGARYARSLAVSLLGLLAAMAWLRLGPLPAGLLDPDPRPSLTIVDRNGEVLFEARSSTGTRGETIDAAHLPPAVVSATLAAEDERFRSHLGVDPIALGRAFVHDVRAMRIVEGGSTITQQVAKLLLARQKGAAPRGWFAKIHEAVIALRLEHRLTKDEILALYLNLAPFGNQIVGVERASHAYFGRAADTLTPAEAAFLAALPQRPGRYNPWTESSKAKPRQQRILAIMRAR